MTNPTRSRSRLLWTITSFAGCVGVILAANLTTRQTTPGNADAQPDQHNGTTSEGRGRWTIDQVRALGATTNVATAASVLGLGRSLAYQLLREDQFPVPVIRAGHRIVVPVAALLRILCADDAETSAPRLDPTPDRRVYGTPAAADYTAAPDNDPGDNP